MGLGAQQATSGINHVFGTDGGIGMQLVVIAVVTFLATMSVVRGINGGVKVLSNVNMLVALGLLIFVTIAGGMAGIKAIPTALMGYIENFIPLSNPHGRDDETVVYFQLNSYRPTYCATFLRHLHRQS